MKEFDVVELIDDFPSYGLHKGQRGAILEIYNDQDYEVEFCDSNGKTIFLGVLTRENLRIVRT